MVHIFFIYKALYPVVPLGKKYVYFLSIESVLGSCTGKFYKNTKNEGCNIMEGNKWIIVCGQYVLGVMSWLVWPRSNELEQ